jgi:hypothetical protein
MKAEIINEFAKSVEIGFNVADSIPIVAIVGSSLRANAACVQFIAAAIFTLIGCIGQIAQSHNFTWPVVFENGCEHMFHGALNYIRALGEFFLATTVIGSIGLFVYQMCSKNGFNPIVSYQPLYSQFASN